VKSGIFACNKGLKVVLTCVGTT